MEQVEDQNGSEDSPEEADTQMERMGSALSKQPKTGLPNWAILPPDFKAPPNRKIVLMRFKPEWTWAPEKGERQIVLWQLTEAEEQFAAQRAQGKDTKVVAELAKQCIRYIDGQRVDWTMSTGVGINVNPFWGEIGSACRKLIIHYYVKAHTLQDAEVLDFFNNCIVSTISVPQV